MTLLDEEKSATQKSSMKRVQWKECNATWKECDAKKQHENGATQTKSNKKRVQHGTIGTWKKCNMKIVQYEKSAKWKESAMKRAIWKKCDMKRMHNEEMSHKKVKHECNTKRVKKEKHEESWKVKEIGIH